MATAPRSSSPGAFPPTAGQRPGVLQRMKLTKEELDYINADLSSEEDSDDDYDPADDAQEPLDLEDFGSSELRKRLRFNQNAKNWMKDDTPKNKKGQYVCHICKLPILKHQKVDMDHLPPWLSRVQNYFKVHDVTSIDDVDPIVLAPLFNMRGSVFAHSSCNRCHAGEGHWKQMWDSVNDWYQKNGGRTLDHSNYK